MLLVLIDTLGSGRWAVAIALKEKSKGPRKLLAPSSERGAARVRLRSGTASGLKSDNRCGSGLHGRERCARPLEVLVSASLGGAFENPAHSWYVR